LFEPAVPNRQPISIPVQDLHLVASSIKEQELLTGQRIELKAMGDNGGKCVKTLAHVGWPQSDEDAVLWPVKA
jgi:hypothetical protein